MSNAQGATVSTTLGIGEGDRVRLIGGTEAVGNLLQPLPTDAVVSNLESESATVGIIVVDGENDMRERLFTELEGLKGADHVWVLTDTSDAGPSVDTIVAEAKVLSWHASSPIELGGWTALELGFPRP